MSVTSSTYVDEQNTVQGEPPWLYGFPFPEPFEERVYSAGYGQLQSDPWNKVLFGGDPPRTYTKLGPTNTNQFKPLVEPAKKQRVFKQNTIRA